jgi:phage major head subunit gpT-like protein
MPTVTPSELPSLVAETGYPVLTEEYERQPAFYAEIGKVRPVDSPELTAPMLGHRELINPGMQRHAEIEVGQEIPGGNAFEGYTVYSKIRKFSRAMVIPKEMIEASNGQAQVISLIERAAQSWGELAAVQKNEFAAGMLQKGTLTAGSAAYFDGSFVGNTDPTPGFIYDGLPFFDTAHTLTGSATTFSNHTASLALSASNLETVLTALRVGNALDERGERMVNTPNVLVVPVNLEGTALRILNSELLAGSANNDVNWLKNRLRVVANPFLTDETAAWWVGNDTRGLQFFDSGMPVLETVYDVRTQSHIVTSTYYFGGSVSDARPWYCANKAAS